MLQRYKNDEAILAGCRKLKPRAQRALYDKYVDIMYNTVYRYTFSHHDTQDVLQMAFTKVYKYLDRFDPVKGSLKSWMRKICIRAALDFLKSKKVTFEEIKDTDLSGSLSYTITEHMDVEYIYALIGQLPPRDRAIFNMSQIEGYSHKEISDLLGINESSSRVYLARIKKQLQDQLGHIHRPKLIVE